MAGMGDAGSAAAELGSARGEPGHAPGRRGRGVEPVQPVGDDAANWERFHLRCNKSARFYMERRRAPCLCRAWHGFQPGLALVSAAELSCTHECDTLVMPCQKLLLARVLRGRQFQV